jgi:mercuric ion transport protein
MRNVGSYLLIVTGLLLCPCHLPLTMPLLVALAGGTALGAWLAGHTGLLYGLAAGYFVIALAAGVWLLNGRRSPSTGGAGDPACCTPARVPPDQPARPERSVE